VDGNAKYKVQNPKFQDKEKSFQNFGFFDEI
jgi:hypothetical protein